MRRPRSPSELAYARGYRRGFERLPIAARERKLEATRSSYERGYFEGRAASHELEGAHRRGFAAGYNGTAIPDEERRLEASWRVYEVAYVEGLAARQKLVRNGFAEPLTAAN